MVHLLDLDDDSLCLIFEQLRDYCPFTSLVCHRFCKLVTMVHFPYPRRAKAGVLMHREELANCYRGDRRLVQLFVSPKSGELQLVYKNLARKFAIIHGTIETVRNVVGVPQCEEVLRAGRVDLLDEIVANNASNTISAAVKFFASQVCVSAHYGTEINTHCSGSLILACAAPSSSAIRWIAAKVNASRLSCNSNWAFIWSELSGVSKRAVTAAASSGSEDTLDFIMELFVEHAPRGRNLIFEGVCAHLILSPTRSVDAWRWLCKTITKRKDTLDTVLKRIVHALQNKEFTHTPRIPPLLDMSFVSKNTTFKVNDCKSYSIVKEGLREGGWLRRAYFDACGYGSNFTFKCLFGTTNPEHHKLRMQQASQSIELEALFVQCAKDTAEDYVRFGTATLCFVVRALQDTADISAEAAYDVAIHIAELQLDSGIQERRRDEMLYKRDLLNVVLLNSIKKCKSAIVQDITSRTRLFCLDKIEIADKVQMVSCASTSSLRTAPMKRIAECLASFCPVDRHVILHAIIRRNHVVFRALVKAACTSVRFEAGKDVLKHPSVDLLEAAIDEECFARSSKEERDALQLLSQHELKQDLETNPWNQRRVMPFNHTVPWKAGKLHPDC